MQATDRDDDMTSKERVLATLKRQPTDRTPIDCWLYQQDFVDKLEAEICSREEFLDEFNIDLFEGYVPWPNQTGRLLDVSELPDFDPGDPRDPAWITHTGWTPDFAGLNVVEATETSAPSLPICGVSLKAPVTSLASKAAGCTWARARN